MRRPRRLLAVVILAGVCSGFLRAFLPPPKSPPEDLAAAQVGLASRLTENSLSKAMAVVGRLGPRTDDFPSLLVGAIERLAAEVGDEAVLAAAMDEIVSRSLPAFHRLLAELRTQTLLARGNHSEDECIGWFFRRAAEQSPGVFVSGPGVADEIRKLISSHAKVLRLDLRLGNRLATAADSLEKEADQVAQGVDAVVETVRADEIRTRLRALEPTTFGFGFKVPFLPVDVQAVGSPGLPTQVQFSLFPKYEFV